MSEEAGFLAAIAAAPADDVLRLVYADWLDEQGDDESTRKAKFLRLQDAIGAGTPTDQKVRQLKKLAGRLTASWLAVVSRPEIENCPTAEDRQLGRLSPEFAYECPKQWADLKATDRPTVRSCDACQQNVYFCESVVEARDHAEQGHCVAVNIPVRRSPGDLAIQYMTMGMMLPPDINEDDKS